MKIFNYRILAFMCCVFAACAIIAQTSVEPSFGGFGFENGQKITKIVYDRNIAISFKGDVIYYERGYIKLSKGTEMSFEFSDNVKSVSSVEFYIPKDVDDNKKIFASVVPELDGYLTKDKDKYAYYPNESQPTTLFLYKWISDGFSPSDKLSLITAQSLNVYRLIVYYGKKYTGITDALADVEEGKVIYYNLQGKPVANPERNSIYIRVDATGATKILY